LKSGWSIVLGVHGHGIERELPDGIQSGGRGLVAPKCPVEVVELFMALGDAADHLLAPTTRALVEARIHCQSFYHVS